MTNRSAMWHVAAVLATVSAVALVNRTAIAYLQQLLSVSHQHALPAGHTADVAIILGYALFKNGSVTEPLKARVEAGVKACAEGGARHVIFSGAHPGSGMRGVSEANAMSAYALQVLGQTPPNCRWLLEEDSTSTRENAAFSIKMVKEHGWSSILLVTNTFHQHRSLLTFRQGLHQAGVHDTVKVYVAEVPFTGHQGYWPDPPANVVMDHVDFWRELAALVYYKVRGFI